MQVNKDLERSESVLRLCLATASIHFIMDVVNGSIYKSAHRMMDVMGIQLVNILLGTSPLRHGRGTIFRLISKDKKCTHFLGW